MLPALPALLLLPHAFQLPQLLPDAALLDVSAIAASPATAAAAVVAVSLIGVIGGAAPLEPYPADASSGALSYDPEQAKNYFRSRPVEVVARALAVFARFSGLGAALLLDYLAGPETLARNADERATALTEVLTQLGPTFIKVGQSASIRTDLLPLPYIRGLTKLQDQVPPFDSALARAQILKELEPAASVFSSLSAEPVAAASLGQVYKGTLAANGIEVAVKVQRPQIARQIALDMYLLRELAVPLAKLFRVPGDLRGTADAWGKGFVAELDYVSEARNAERFNEDVKASPLEGKVFAPAVVASASSGRVLTTVWVDGERLDQCSVPSDVPRLCSVAIATFLEMLLSVPPGRTCGSLHADPHPGNLLRTPSGSLCVLDWGLVQEVPNDIQLTMIEHVAHLTAKDYAKVPNDLVELGFVPRGSESVVVENGVVDYLTRVYSAWGSGGGAAKLDVPKLFAEVCGTYSPS